MFYREAGDFKTSNADDQQAFAASPLNGVNAKPKERAIGADQISEETPDV